MIREHSSTTYRSLITDVDIIDPTKAKEKAKHNFPCHAAGEQLWNITIDCCFLIKEGGPRHYGHAIGVGAIPLTSKV